MQKKWRGGGESYCLDTCGIALHLEWFARFLIANFDAPTNNASAGCMELLRQPAEYSGLVFEGRARIVECRKEEEEGTGGGAEIIQSAANGNESEVLTLKI